MPQYIRSQWEGSRELSTCIVVIGRDYSNVLTRIVEPRREEVTEERRTFRKEELHNLHSSPIIIVRTISRSVQAGGFGGLCGSPLLTLANYPNPLLLAQKIKLCSRYTSIKVSIATHHISIHLARPYLHMPKLKICVACWCEPLVNKLAAQP